jgi:hypothetical protein
VLGIGWKALVAVIAITAGAYFTRPVWTDLFIRDPVHIVEGYRADSSHNLYVLEQPTFDANILPLFDSKGEWLNDPEIPNVVLEQGALMPAAVFDLHLTNVASGEVRITNISVVPTKMEDQPSNGVLLHIQYEGAVEPGTRIVSRPDSADSRFYEVDDTDGSSKKTQPFFATNTILIDGGGSHTFSMEVLPEHSAIHFQIRIDFDYRGRKRTIYALNSERDFYVTAPRCVDDGRLGYEAAYRMTVARLQTKAPVELNSGLDC